MSIKYIQNNNSGSRVLVVDDEVAVGHLVSEILSINGYEVSLFNNSREALCEFENAPHKFDLVVTDHSMPGMTGTELMQKLMAVRPDLPVILSSGDCNQFGAENAVLQGAYGYVVKPINMSSFLELIQGALIKCTSDFI